MNLTLKKVAEYLEVQEIAFKYDITENSIMVTGYTPTHVLQFIMNYCKELNLSCFIPAMPDVKLCIAPR